MSEIPKPDRHETEEGPYVPRAGDVIAIQEWVSGGQTTALRLILDNVENGQACARVAEQQDDSDQPPYKFVDGVYSTLPNAPGEEYTFVERLTKEEYDAMVNSLPGISRYLPNSEALRKELEKFKQAYNPPEAPEN